MVKGAVEMDHVFAAILCNFAENAMIQADTLFKNAIIHKIVKRHIVNMAKQQKMCPENIKSPFQTLTEGSKVKIYLN